MSSLKCLNIYCQKVFNVNFLKDEINLNEVKSMQMSARHLHFVLCIMYHLTTPKNWRSALLEKV